MSNNESGGRFMLGVVIAALMSTLTFMLSAAGLFGSILGSTVDARDALGEWGIQLTPEAAKGIINWGIAVFGIIVIWIFAFFILSRFKVLPGQEYSPKFELQHARITATLIGLFLFAVGCISIAGIQVLSAIVPYIAIIAGVAMIVMACFPDQTILRFRNNVIANLGSFGDVLYELTFVEKLGPPMWRLEGTEPGFDKTQIPDHNKTPAVSINDNAGPYSLEHRLPWPSPDVHSVEFITQTTETTELSLLCRLHNPGGGRSIDRWLVIKKGEGKPNNRKRNGRTEWIVLIEPTQIVQSWESLVVGMQEQWAETFGSEGAAFEALIAIKISGSMSLARLTMRK